MKSKINTRTAVSSYPKLMQSDITEMVVLMFSEASGTVLHLGNNNHFKIGESYSSFDMPSFSPFAGELVLSND